MSSTTNPARFNARIPRLPLTAGSPPCAISRGHGHATNFGVRIGRNSNAVIAPVGEDGLYGLLRIGERFFLGIAFRDYLRKCRDEHGETAVLLRFKNDGQTEAFSHQTAPSVARAPMAQYGVGNVAARARLL